MRKFVLTAVAAAVLAACGQSAEAPEAEAGAAPQSIADQLATQSAEMRPVFAYQQLVAYFAAHPDLQQTCEGPRGAEERGVIPANVDPATPYAPFVGSTAFAIQCGERLTTVGDDPRKRWLVIFSPDAEEVQVVSCAGPRESDQCRSRAIPTVETAPPG